MTEDEKVLFFQRLAAHTAQCKQTENALAIALKNYLQCHEDHELPESFQASVVADTGLQGGDSGHGGSLTLKFDCKDGCGANRWWTVPVGEADGAGYTGSVFLEACGDWEQSGLISTIADMLHSLVLRQSAEV